MSSSSCSICACTFAGIPFIFAGEEVYRDKKGVNNTYESPDSINQIDWNNKTTYNDIFTYYQGLIALRKAHPAFRMTSLDMMKKHLKFIELGVPNVVAFTLSNNANGDSWKNILVIYNGNRKNINVELPEGEWNVAVHDGKISVETPLFTVKNPKFVVGASSASIMYSPLTP